MIFFSFLLSNFFSSARLSLSLSLLTSRLVY